MTVPPYVLTYAAPAGCPAEDAFRRDVSSRLQDDTRAANVRLDVAIEEDDGRYRGTITALDDAAKESARRRIEGKSCPEVAHALAFLAGLLVELNGHLDPEVGPAAPPPPPEPPAPPEPAPKPDAQGPPARLAQGDGTASGSRLPIAGLVLADARGGFGPSVDLSGEVGMEVGLGLGAAAPAVRLVGFVGSGSLRSWAGSGAVWFGGGRLELCPARTRGTRLVVRVCAGGEVGVVHVQGDVPLKPHAVTVPWGSVEVTVQLRWFATRALFAELGGGPLLPLDRTRYYFEPDTTLYQVPVLVARLAIGLGWQF